MVGVLLEDPVKVQRSDGKDSKSKQEPVGKTLGKPECLSRGVHL